VHGGLTGRLSGVLDPRLVGKCRTRMQQRPSGVTAGPTFWVRNAGNRAMLRVGRASASYLNQSGDDSEPLLRIRFPEEFKHMNKVIIVSLAILGLSTSAALAAKHHAKKPEVAAAGPTYAAETHIFHVSDGDKELYAKNKRESGMK
jgi:hypothetical protein